jgi:ABC-type phosphate transport system substrate-binding protein
MKQFNTWFMPSLLMAVFFTASASAIADVVAIVNKANTSASKSDIARLYSLETKTWADGSTAKLYDLSGTSERDTFYMAYTGKNAAGAKSSWAKAVFTGRATPPKMLDSDNAVKNEVANDKNAVGYVNESSVDGSVRIVR